MDEFNFNNKVFYLIENSESGKVNSETVFNYQQKGNIVTADYAGGTIKYGKIIATLDDDILNMIYQCVTSENELKAGKALAKISLRKENSFEIELAMVKWKYGKRRF